MRMVAYGAGMALLQMQAVRPLTLAYIVDDTPSLAGQEVMGLPVFPSSHLATECKDDLQVVIFANTPRAILGIAQSLNSMGLVWGENYVDCSMLQYESMKARMHDRLGVETSEERFRRVRLLSLYTSIQSLSTIAGTWLFVELLENLQCSGDIAECGVYNGGNALISLLCSTQAAERPYHLLDSFEGFPELSPNDPGSRKSDFKDVNLASIRDVFRNFKNVHIHQRLFTDTLPSLASEKFAAVYIDCDLYEPTLELCEFFYPRLADGGFLLFHDYWVPEGDPPLHLQPFRGVNRAVGEFLGADLGRLVVFPETTHAVLVKSAISATG